jgi:hypothetical protein
MLTFDDRVYFFLFFLFVDTNKVDDILIDAPSDIRVGNFISKNITVMRISQAKHYLDRTKLTPIQTIYADFQETSIYLLLLFIVKNQTTNLKTFLIFI